jgi:UDP-glucose 4-epimerase
MAYKVKLNLLENVGNEVPKQIKQATEDFARGVSAYLMKNHKLHYPVSNAFCKLWEMLNNIDYWKNAPLWDKEKIGIATKTWFKYLE